MPNVLYTLTDISRAYHYNVSIIIILCYHIFTCHISSAY